MIKSWSERANFIAKIVKGKDILDVGACGESTNIGNEKWLHRIIAEHASSVLGLDSNLKAVKRAQTCFNILYGNAENFSFNFNRKFDVVVAGELIEHLSNPGLFLECAKRHLRRNGLLLITTPNLRNIPHLLNWRWGPDHDHVCVHNEHTLSNLLARHGFKVIYKTYMDIPNTFKGKIFLRFFPFLALCLVVVAKMT